jgi:hypothetical protein
MHRPLFRRFAATLAATWFGSTFAFGFAYIGPTWPDGAVTMHLQLGVPTKTLTDQAPDWATVAQSALDEWNVQLARAKFTVVRDSTAAIRAGNRINNVAFAPTVYGEPFGDNVLAVTLGSTDRTTLAPTERDVLFNSNLQWDSYRGALTGTVVDFRRVALHEFGHVLGLDHPDQPDDSFSTQRSAQNVAAIMRSRISSGTETLRPDDIAGVKALYDAYPNAALAQSRTTTAGSAGFTISVPTGGAGPFTYFYYFLPSGSNFMEHFAFAAGPSYTIGSVQPADAGTFVATATNTATGAFFSNVATLVVPASTTTSDTTLANISTRGAVGTGNGVLIAGLAIGGTTPKSVLIRAAGPALNDFGVGGALGDPTLSIYASANPSVALATNDNWEAQASGSAAAVAAAATRLGAFQFKPGSRDAALLTTLAPGSYTAIVSGVANTTGVALVETYDADADAATSRSRKLVNIATRGRVESGENALIAGLVVSGPGPRTYLIRAVGFTLTRGPFNVTDALRDPVLQVYRGETLLRENDDWDSPAAGQPALREAAQKVGAFALLESRSNSGLDSAMLMTLQPGNYTAKVSGFEGASGVALVEIYEVP